MLACGRCCAPHVLLALLARLFARSLAPLRLPSFSLRAASSTPEFLPTSRGGTCGFLSGCEDHVGQMNCCGRGNQRAGVGKVMDLYEADNQAPQAPRGYTGTNNMYIFSQHAWTVLLAVPPSHSSCTPPYTTRMRPSRCRIGTRRYNRSAGPQTRGRAWSPQSTSESGHLGPHPSNAMWNNTLLIYTHDNGSPACGWGASGSNAPSEALRPVTGKAACACRPSWRAADLSPAPGARQPRAA